MNHESIMQSIVQFFTFLRLLETFVKILLNFPVVLSGMNLLFVKLLDRLIRTLTAISSREVLRVLLCSASRSDSS